MVDHVPLDPRDPAAPRPQLRTLTLLVGRMTTIKLAYWAALTAWEIAAPRGLGTAFATASVVAAPASIPLLLVERVRSAEGCAAQITCHSEAIWLWVATFLIGFLVLPAAFALALRPDTGGPGG